MGAVPKVREAIKLIETDGWQEVITRGSHRQFKHPTKTGRVTICGKAVRRPRARHLQQHPETGGSQRMNMHRFLIVIESAGNNFSAYSLNPPGCVATGATREETERRMYERSSCTSRV